MKARPIAMRATQEQFESIKPKLEKAGIEITDRYFDLDKYPYLTNFYEKNFGIGSVYLDMEEREKTETWNEQIFLEACGIEVKESYQITKEQILITHASTSSFNQEEIESWYPSVFKEDKKELVVGKWYWYEKTLFNYQLDWNVYGFNEDGSWCKTKSWIWKKSTGYEREATPQEIQQALEKEARKRGFTIGVWVDNTNICEIGGKYLIYIEDFELLGNIFTVGKDCICLMNSKGQWATIIPTITKKEAEEKLNCKIV